MGNTRRLPTKSSVYNYWLPKLSIKPKSINVCWGCGFSGFIHRCHLKSKHSGGGDKEDNIVLLCRDCHSMQEAICSVPENVHLFKESLLSGNPLKDYMEGVLKSRLNNIKFEPYSSLGKSCYEKEDLVKASLIEVGVHKKRTSHKLNELKENGVKLGNPNGFTSSSRRKAKQAKKRNAENNYYTIEAKDALEKILNEYPSIKLHRIAIRLNSMGCKTARGKEFTKSNVRYLIDKYYDGRVYCSFNHRYIRQKK